MKFLDLYVSRRERFTIGIEEDSGRYYVSIPVSNPYVDYEEYYEISKSQFNEFQCDVRLACEFVYACRRHEKDDLLIVKPGTLRGTPS